jgi:hypothetical protein
MTHLDLVSKAQVGLAKKIKNEGGGYAQSMSYKKPKKIGGPFCLRCPA